ncbi:hypothetical protein LPJ61_000315 [Coemansia biformis]|uniref:Protein kinase domain-containing protein n=1 Tax=Coemansia biformis TaxID=1286918 RepID=A0A9W7YIL1_9FUNG|nr:hypothetical protein LPJ61_000315 [Coemansia biformis]
MEDIKRARDEAQDALTNAENEFYEAVKKLESQLETAMARLVEPLVNAERKFVAVKAEIVAVKDEIAAAEDQFAAVKHQLHEQSHSVGSALLPADGLGVFSPLQVDAFTGTSSHRCKTAIYHYDFYLDHDLARLVPLFQDDCLRNPQVAGATFSQVPLAADGSENAFVDHAVAVLEPRLVLISKEILGLANVFVAKLHKNSSRLSTAFEPEVPVDLERSLDQSLLDMHLFVPLTKYRCEVFKCTWCRVHQVVVKAAPCNDDELVAEITNEVEIYHCLHSLQGTVIPWLYDYGHMWINGNKYMAIVVEQIEDKDLGAGLELDTRLSLTELSDAERTACMNALGRIHGLGVTHSDVRGANLLFRDKAGQRGSPVYIDFGFAKVMDDCQQAKIDRQDDYLRLLKVFKGHSFHG